jgi:hypothetical protein
MADKINIDSLRESLSFGLIEEGILENVIQKDSLKTADDKIRLAYLINQANIGSNPNADSLNVPTELDISLENINWESLGLKGLGLNPTTGGEWSSIDEIYAYLNVRVDIANTILDPYFTIGQKIGHPKWSWWNGSENFDVVGNPGDNSNQKAYNNWKLAQDGLPQSNPYMMYSSSFIYGDSDIQEDWSTGDFWLSSAVTDLIPNLFRYNVSELMNNNPELISPKLDNYLWPDMFNPLAITGHRAAWDWDYIEDDYQGGPSIYGVTPSIYAMNYQGSKQEDLQEVVDHLVDGRKGHYIVTDGGNKVYIKMPNSWKSFDQTKGGNPYKKNWRSKDIYEGLKRPPSSVTEPHVQTLRATITANEGIVQGDFVSSFNTHQIIGIHQSDRQNNDNPLTIYGDELKDKSFYYEESKTVPGFGLSYTSGASYFALGANYDPYSSEIRSLRFGEDYPGGPEITIAQAAAYSFAHQPLPRQYSHNKFVESVITTHFHPFKYNKGGNPYMGTAALTGFDKTMIDGQHSSSRTSLYSYGRGKRLHSSEGLMNGNFDFVNVLKNNNWTDEQIQASEARADSAGIVAFKRHLKHLLENADMYGTELIITSGLDQLKMAIGLASAVNNAKVLNTGKLLELDEVDKTEGSQYFMQLTPNEGNRSPSEK